MFTRIGEDLRSIRERDPAARSCLEVFFLYSGFHALLFYRVSHRLHKWKLKFLARLVSQIGRFFTGVEIHPAAKIGRGLFIDHGMGVVIGETTEIGDYVTIYQGVTLGGTGKETGKRHPTIGNNVLIGAGAKVLGPFTVGDYARIAANAVVLDEVPPHSTVVGVPGRVVRLNGKRIPNLDQIHIPDPVAQELCRMRIRLEKLEKAMNIESPNEGPNPCDLVEGNKPKG
jgi:serine O-acetyltransferase